MAAKRESAGITKYSEPIEGDRGNYRWPVGFSYDEDGYLGIAQGRSHVLLSPGQVTALKRFTSRRPTHV